MYFSIPSVRTESEQREAWKRALKSLGIGEKKVERARVCDLHFVSGAPSGFPGDVDYAPAPGPVQSDKV